MSQYRKVMINAGVMQKDVLQAVHRTDARVDKPLLSKIVNDVILPTPRQLAEICAALSCDVLDIYDPREIALAPETPRRAAGKSVATDAERKRKHRAENDVYNLTAEISGEKARRLFNPDALRKLGVLNKTDFVRQAVDAALHILDVIEAAQESGKPRDELLWAIYESIRKTPSDAATSDGNN